MTTETMTATTSRASSVASRKATFFDTLASEWVKLTTLRSTYLTIGLGLLLSVGTTALVAVAVGNSFDGEGLGPVQEAAAEPIITSMVGNIFTLIVFSVFGVLASSSEYSSGMIRLTLTATPRRARVLWAKVLLVTGATLVFGLVSTIAMFLVGQAVLAAYGMPMTDLADPDAQRMVFGLGAVTPLYAIAGLSLGVILRSTAGAITSVLALIWLPVIFGPLLPTSWQERVLSLLPGPALDSLTVAHLAESPMYPDPAVGAVTAVAWIVAFIGAAYLVLRRRDA